VERQLTVSHFRMGQLKRWVPLRILVELDALAQLTGDWWQLSPSVFVLAKRVGQDAILPYSGLVFRCPECGHDPLVEGQAELLCSNCSRRYPIEGGIYDFRDQHHET
jgi:hypothetical protein